MLSIEDTNLIENSGNVKNARRLLKEFPNKADILNLSYKQESPDNAKGTCDSGACMKAHCEQM